MKIVIIVALIAIVGALGLAGRAMLKDGRNGAPKSNRMVRALAGPTLSALFDTSDLRSAA